MTATHSPGCPALVDVRDGCACLLRVVAAQGDHLPEVRRVAHYTQRGVSNEPDDGKFSWVRAIDTEAALRACEARVREEWASEELALRETTWLAALDAATEAVYGAPILDVTDGPEGQFVLRLDDAIAAIAALKEKP